MFWSFFCALILFGWELAWKPHVPRFLLGDKVQQISTARRLCWKYQEIHAQKILVCHFVLRPSRAIWSNIILVYLSRTLLTRKLTKSLRSLRQWWLPTSVTSFDIWRESTICWFIRLTKVMEVILTREDLTKNLRAPAISRLQKVYNCDLGLKVIKKSIILNSINYL